MAQQPRINFASILLRPAAKRKWFDPKRSAILGQDGLIEMSKIILLV